MELRPAFIRKYKDISIPFWIDANGQLWVLANNLANALAKDVTKAELKDGHKRVKNYNLPFNRSEIIAGTPYLFINEYGSIMMADDILPDPEDFITWLYSVFVEYRKTFFDSASDSFPFINLHQKSQFAIAAGLDVWKLFIEVNNEI